MVKFIAQEMENRPTVRYDRFARWLERRLHLIGKNKSWLARELGVRLNTVSDWAAGRVPPSEDKMRSLATLFEVPLGELYEALYGDTNPVDVLADIAEQRGKPRIKKLLATLREAGAEYRIKTTDFNPSQITDRQIAAFEQLLTNLLIQHAQALGGDANLPTNGAGK